MKDDDFTIPNNPSEFMDNLEMKQLFKEHHITFDEFDVNKLFDTEIITELDTSSEVEAKQWPTL